MMQCLYAALVLALGAQGLFAAPCMLVVNIKNTRGLLLSDVPVVVRSDSRPAEAAISIKAQSDMNGNARVCDLPIGLLYHITIGQEMCGQQIWRYLSVNVVSPMILSIVYEPCHGIEIPPGCTIVVRPPPDLNRGGFLRPRVWIGKLEKLQKIELDEFGRLVFILHWRDTAKVWVGSARREFECATVVTQEWNLREVPWSKE